MDVREQENAEPAASPPLPVHQRSLWRAWAPVVYSVVGFACIGFGGLLALRHRWLGASLALFGALLVLYSISGRSGSGRFPR